MIPPRLLCRLLPIQLDFKVLPGAVLGLAALLTALAAGCDRPAEPHRVAVFKTKGAISYLGQAVPGAFVVLHPRASSDAAVPTPTAHVKPDGTFEVSTYDAGDGAAAGEYTVTVEWRQLLQQQGEFVPGPNVLPAKYGHPTTSDLVVRIAEGQNDLPPITLQR
jgi:hypothetical protein